MSNRVILFLFLLAAVSCTGKKAGKEADTVSSGMISISVDESFQPIIKQEIIIFENDYPDASIFPIYTNEVDAVNLLLKDSVRLAITTRKLTDDEKKLLLQKKMVSREVKLATDGIAIIINNSNKDSLITIQQLRRVMAGEATDWKDLYPESRLGRIELTFDNANSSSVRFAIDSICKGKPLSGKLYAQKNNEEVIRHIAKTPNAIGVIGVSWLGDKADSTRLSFINNVKLMSVSNAATATEGNSYKPFQAYLALKSYPLTRDVYAISTDPKAGLATGFLSFMASDIGQKIILREGIVPATQVVRIVNVKDDL